MAKRTTGQGSTVESMGRTPFQRKAHDTLIGNGFAFARRNSHGSNIYHHPNGRSVHVQSTPASPTTELKRIKREVRGASETPNEGEIVSSTEAVASPVTQYVAMADPFLLKQPKSLLEQRARASALAGWVKRVLERHGPLLSTDLLAAATQLGFSDGQIQRARTAAGAVSFTIPGEGAGRGRGGQVARVGLPHQLPEGVSRSGRPPAEEPATGVAPVNGEEVGTTISPPDAETTMVNGAAPERTPEEQAFVGRAQEVMAEPEFQEAAARVLHLTPTPRSTPPESDSENRDDPIAVPAGYVPGTITLAAEGDVAAAAMMLLESLGVKKPGDEAREALRKAMHEVETARAACDTAYIALSYALQSLS